MSKLTEAMQILDPVLRPENWNGDQWAGNGNVRSLVSDAVRDMSEVDAMMTEIARATSLPATAEERTGRAVELAAVEMRALPADRWPDWIADLLETAQSGLSEQEYRGVLQSLCDRLGTRLDGRGASA
jgi:hypothetical protein